jgi:hypothetical protein
MTAVNGKTRRRGEAEEVVRAAVELTRISRLIAEQEF